MQTIPIEKSTPTPTKQNMVPATTNNRQNQNVFRRTQIDDRVFFKNADGTLLHLIDGVLKCYGVFDNVAGKPKMKTINPSKYKHRSTVLPHKKTVIYFVSRELHFHSMLLCETLQKKFNVNVLVFGPHLWNVIINGVHFLDVMDEKNLQLVNCNNVTSIYIESFKFFLYFTKANFEANIFYVYHYQPLFENYKSLDLSDYGIHFSSNLIHLIEKFFFYNEDDKKFFLQSLDQQNNSDMLRKCVVSEYIVHDVKFKNQIQDDQKQDQKQDDDAPVLLSYDKYTEDAIELLKYYVENINPKTKLYIFQNREMMVNLEERYKNIPNIIVKHRNVENYIKFLRVATHYITTEVRSYTHFMMTLASKCVKHVFVPSYFKNSCGKDNAKFVYHENLSDLLSIIKFQSQSKH